MSNDPNSVYERFIEIFKTFKYWVWGTFKFSEMTVNQAIDIEAPNHVIYDPQSTSFDRLPIVTFTLEEDSDDKTVYSVLIYDKTENSNFAREFAANAVLSKIDVIRQGGYYCHRYRKTYLNRKILDHSIDFFNLSEDPPVCKNSFKDFHLIPVIRPWNDRGPLSLMIAGIPDTERRVDITNFLQEGEKRGVPTGEWEFYIDHEKWKDWATCYRALVHYFHGFKMVLRLKDYELDRLFIGRITVKNYTPGNDYSKIVLEYQLLREANIDPSKLGLCFQAWWLDWNGDPIDYIPIPWGSTPSTSSTDDGTSYGPDPSAAYDNQTFTPDLPVRIEIIQQPSILSYYDGATINYSGISVRAFNSAGNIWSANSKYLSGMIPYSELQFPVSMASIGSAASEAFPVSQLLPVQWMRPVDYAVLSSAFSIAVIKDTSIGGDDLIMRTYVSYINDDVTFISDYAFCSYDTLKTASFRNVSKIGRYAFANTSLSSLYLLYNGIVSIESTADLTNRTGLKIYVPSSLYSAYKADNVWSNYSRRFYSYSLTYPSGDMDYTIITGETALIERGPTKWINNKVDYIASYVFTSYPGLKEARFGNCKWIGSSAFYSCSELTNISFPVCMSIGKYAFYSCSSLTEAIFPVCTSIGSRAFFNCKSIITLSFDVYSGAVNSSIFGTYTNSNLKTANFPVCTSIGSGAFEGCSSLTSVNFPACTNIGWSAFRNCSSLTSVNFPACTNIGWSAFYNCISLTEPNFPACISIGSSAFERCSSLTEANFPACTSIETYAFQYCYSLTEAIFPACISIGGCAFQSCYSLTSISFPVCTSIGTAAFASCTSLTSVFFPVCMSIGNSAFYNCSSLTEVNFPACISIGNSAFESCSSLTEVSFPTCTNIGNWTFASCSSLASISFPACKSIGYWAFRRCINLVSASFPVCTCIESYAFYSCSSLTSVSFPACTSIGSSAFMFCSSLTEAIFPACTSIGSYAFIHCKSIITLSFDAYTGTITSDDFGTNANINLKTANFPVCTSIGSGAFEGCSSLTEVNFPACTSIGNSAFESCSSLTEVNFPTCTNIGNWAFHRCINLVSASFPVCTCIESYAFYSCSSLTSVSFPVCASIGKYAFYSCSSLIEANFPVCTSIGRDAFQFCSSLTEVNFPACTSIGNSAFGHCSSLTEANFPACTNIGSSAFYNCNSLQKLLIGGSIVVSFPGLPTPFSTKAVWHSETSSYTYEPANGSFWGSIFVPASLLADYQTATGWSAYSSRFAAI